MTCSRICSSERAPPAHPAFTQALVHSRVVEVCCSCPAVHHHILKHSTKPAHRQSSNRCFVVTLALTDTSLQEAAPLLALGKATHTYCQSAYKSPVSSANNRQGLIMLQYVLLSSCSTKTCSVRYVVVLGCSTVVVLYSSPAAPSLPQHRCASFQPGHSAHSSKIT